MSSPASSAQSTSATSADQPPEHFHPLLAGCKWAALRAGAFSLKDERGQVLGIGATQQVAADIAVRVRQAATVQPQGYHDCLSGYRFTSHPRSSTSNDKLLWTAVVDAAGKTVAFAATRSDAALAAARYELRLRDVCTLSMENFRRICTVITVDVARGKTGKAKSGTPYLRMDTREDPADMGRYRGLVTRLLVDTHSGAPDFQTYEARTRWATEVGDDLLLANFFDGPTKAVRLDNGEWLVLRKPDAPPARRCIELAHHEALQCAVDAGVEAEPAREHDRMR